MSLLLHPMVQKTLTIRRFYNGPGIYFQSTRIVSNISMGMLFWIIITAFKDNAPVNNNGIYVDPFDIIINCKLGRGNCWMFIIQNKLLRFSSNHQ